MAGFLGALEYVLEEGPQYEWLQDTSVAICAWICGISAIAFFYRVLTAEEPIVDIRAFTDRNFGIGCLISFCVGIGLYGLTYMYPRYLAEVRGYSALMIGETMFVSGATMFLMAPIVGRLMLQGRYAADHRRRPRHLRARLLPDDVDHPRLRFLRTAAAADPARHRHDVRDGADQHHRARHLAAGSGQERLGPVQPDAQSRRRGRARAHQPGAERPHRPAYLAAAGPGDLGQHHRDRNAQPCSPSACRAWATPR